VLLHGHFLQGRLKINALTNVGEQAKHEARQILAGHALQALLEIRVPRDEAGRLARAWCGIEEPKAAEKATA
jgi:hypothetical protein